MIRGWYRLRFIAAMRYAPHLGVEKMRLRRVRLQRGISAAVLWGLAVTGCASPKTNRFHYDNFAGIQPHRTTRAEVVGLLGEPDQKLGEDWWMYRRPEEHLHAIIEFDASGLVSRKQWIDAEGGETWQDTADRTAKP
jgi:hypothetical protein